MELHSMTVSSSRYCQSLGKLSVKPGTPRCRQLGPLDIIRELVAALFGYEPTKFVQVYAFHTAILALNCGAKDYQEISRQAFA